MRGYTSLEGLRGPGAWCGRPGRGIARAEPAGVLRQHWERSLLLPGSSHSLQRERRLLKPELEPHTFPELQGPQHHMGTPHEPSHITPSEPPRGLSFQAATHQHWETRHRRLGLHLVPGCHGWRNSSHGTEAEPKNMPVAAERHVVTRKEEHRGLAASPPQGLPLPPPPRRPSILPSGSPQAWGILVGISMPYLHFSASRAEVKTAGASWSQLAQHDVLPDTPFMGSLSPCAAASARHVHTNLGRGDTLSHPTPHVPPNRGKALARPITQPRRPSSHSQPSSPPTPALLSYRFLKGALHERSSVLAVNSMAVMAIKWPRQVMVSQEASAGN